MMPEGSKKEAALKLLHENALEQDEVCEGMFRVIVVRRRKLAEGPFLVSRGNHKEVLKRRIIEGEKEIGMGESCLVGQTWTS